jgi:hypothetical protein
MEVVNMKKLLIPLILLVFTSAAYAATTYKWVDKEGFVNYTDDYNKIPSEYRDRVGVEVREDIPTVVTPVAPQTPPQKEEEVKTDIYGRDETWWRGKVRPLKEQLKEATANHERAHEKFMKKAEELSMRRYGSPTQYKSNIIELDRLKEEMMKYEAQMTEAKEMLEKLSKEAKEAKADPTWLNQ